MLKSIKSFFKRPDSASLVKSNLGLPGSYGLNLPNLELLWFSDKDANKICIGYNLSFNLNPDDISTELSEGDDPSTIFLKLPVNRHDLKMALEPLDYYPSYAGLSPEQRWLYLKWLEDVSRPIDIGYVFIYYYGLERHLLMGRYDEAFDEIVKLRHFHTHSSFLHYSQSALLNSTVLKKRFDRIEYLSNIGVKFEMTNISLILAHSMGRNLTASDLMGVFLKITDLNKRYFKEDPIQFQNILERVMLAKFGSNQFPFATAYKLNDLPKVSWGLFANTSIPENIRAPELPHFYDFSPFLRDLRNIFMTTHDEFKKTKKAFKAKHLE